MNELNHILKANRDNFIDSRGAILAACLILEGELTPEDRCERALTILRTALKVIDSRQEEIETMALNNLRKAIRNV